MTFIGAHIKNQFFVNIAWMILPITLFSILVLPLFCLKLKCKILNAVNDLCSETCFFLAIIDYLQFQGVFFRAVVLNFGNRTIIAFKGFRIVIHIALATVHKPRFQNDMIWPGRSLLIGQIHPEKAVCFYSFYIIEEGI